MAISETKPRSRVSVHLSQVGVLLKQLNVGSRKQCQHDSPDTLVFWCRRSWQNSNGVTSNGGAKCRWGRLKFGDFWEITRCNWKMSTVTSIVNLVQWQVYHHLCCTFAVMHKGSLAAGVTVLCCYNRVFCHRWFCHVVCIREWLYAVLFSTSSATDAKSCGPVAFFQLENNE